MILDREVTGEIKSQLNGLRNLPVRMVKTREFEGELWQARSLGEPLLGDSDLALGPGRVRFIEEWQKAGGLYKVGRATVEIQYIFPGTSMFTCLEEDDTEMDVSFGDTFETTGGVRRDGTLLEQKKMVVLDDFSNNSETEKVPDRAYSLVSKFRFLEDGTSQANLKFVVEDEPYMVGLDDDVSTENLQAFGRVAAQHEADFVERDMCAEEVQDICSRLAEFVLVESERIGQRQEEGRLYYV